MNELEIGINRKKDLNFCTSEGINYYIGYIGDEANILAEIEDDDKYLISKEDAREMSLTARAKGINSVNLYTNYGVELHSRYEKPELIGLNKIIKIGE